MKLGTNMLHKTVFVLAKSQQAETWTYQGTWVNFYVSKRTVGSFETLSLSLKEGTNGRGCFLRDVVTFGTCLVGTSKSLKERGTNGCHGWIGWNSHETHVHVGGDDGLDDDDLVVESDRDYSTFRERQNRERQNQSFACLRWWRWLRQ